MIATTQVNKLFWPAIIVCALFNFAAYAQTVEVLKATGLAVDVWKTYGIVGLALLSNILALAVIVWMVRTLVNIAVKAARNHSETNAAIAETNATIQSLVVELREITKPSSERREIGTHYKRAKSAEDTPI